MTEFSAKSGAKWIASALIVAGFLSCRQVLPAEEYLAAYEKEALQTFEMGAYTVKLLYQSPDYVVARELKAGVDPKEAKSLGVRFAAGIYVAVSISPREIQGTPEDLSRDFLNSSLLEGEAAFRDKLTYLQGGIRGKVRLLDASKKPIPPSTYNFTRNFGMGKANTFIFAFPARSDGKTLDVRDLEIVLEDFGLNSGTLRAPLKYPGSLALRVNHE